MAKLTPTLPVAPQESCRIGIIECAPIDLGAIHHVALGKDQIGDDMLQKLAGLSWPLAGTSTRNQQGLCALWFAPRDCLVIGDLKPAEDATSRITDQSDGWAAFSLHGPNIADVLARLCPVDMRVAAFPVDAVARTLLNHCPAIYWRQEAERICILVFRSMAKTAWHDICAAAQNIADRETLG